MERSNRRLFVLVFSLLLALSASPAGAGSLDPPALPDEAAGARFTLDDLYNRLETGEAGSKRGGGFVEPGLAPESTGRTTDDIMSTMPAKDDANGAGPDSVCDGKTFWGLSGGAWGNQTGERDCTPPPDIPVCFGIPAYNPMVCGGKGNCVADDTCVCFGDWTGPQCELEWRCDGISMLDPSACSGRGTCYETDACDCDDGYFGDNCENQYTP